MNYQQALDYIYSFVDYEKTPHTVAQYELGRIRRLLALLGDPQDKIKSVHVAGTKGKGSTCAMIASVLSVSGYKTGLFTSPHLIDFRERFQIDGKPISEDRLVELLERLKPFIETVNKESSLQNLTTFEILTALCFYWFNEEGIDFQVLETGLGGRLDATNLVTPEVSVITSISYDHMDVLGNALSEIATEKAGIIKQNGTVVISPQPEEAGEVFIQTVRRLNARLIRVGDEITFEKSDFDGSGQNILVKGRLSTYRFRIPLIGEHQLENAATAVGALEVLIERGYKITMADISRGFAKVNWPGRLQVMQRKPMLVVDGAHNTDSTRKLTESLRRHFKFEKAILVFGASRDKDLKGIVAELAPAFHRIIIVKSRHPRAAQSDILAAEFRKLGKEVEISGSVAEGITLALSYAGESDMVCVSGSLFVVGETLQYYGQKIARTEMDSYY